MHALDATGSFNVTTAYFENFTGNIIPNLWYKKITTPSGKPDVIAMTILAEITYWHRPGKGGEKKFKGDALQSSYQYFSEKFGYSKESIRRALVKLESLGLVRRELRTIEYYGQKYNNVLFLHLAEVFEKKISPEEQKSTTPSPQNCIDHIKNKENKKEISRSVFLNENKALANFLPISDDDIEILKLRSGRDFNANFIKELILKLNLKYPDHKFYNKTNFLNYMTKALANERSSIVDNAFPKEFEKVLGAIESSLSTSPDTIFKKKIIGVFAPEIAHELLTGTSIIFKDKLEMKINRELNLGEEIPNWIVDILSEEANSLGYIFEIYQIPQSDGDYKWKEVRNKLAKYYDKNIDRVWFSKLKLHIKPSEKLAVIESPTGFIRDWVKTNYGMAIEKEVLALYRDDYLIDFACADTYK